MTVYSALAVACAGRRSVDSSGCEQARAKRKQQGLATVGSSSMVRARLRVAQSGLGRAGRWLVQVVAVATAAAKVTQGFTMGGRE